MAEIVSESTATKVVVDEKVEAHTRSEKKAANIVSHSAFLAL
jgi:hypothetical protein